MKSPEKALQEANREIEKMALNHYLPKEIAQSESVYYNSFKESEEFHFTLTVLFVKDDQFK
ncbi:hypothetical protein G3I01_16170 [Gramella sp. MT6]|uniref:hypothetical protein n=1 Tax=Gramella sp. MT6 TaxID=2705471 RepID=UPI001C5FB686|nr:hypothetical protein [Gramella sp. MT6]QYA26965.1 hypothetical protein G3I01_16170 [Gramella sp. MT6]